MRGVAKLVLRGATIALSLAAIFGALLWLDRTHELWRATLWAVAAFYGLVHVVPGAIFRLQSMPYTYQLRNNLGARGFELQNLTYAAYHTHWYNRATHAAFPLEAWLWLVVAAHFGGALAAAGCSALLVAQAFTFGERRFAQGLSAVWVLFAASAWATASAWGEEAYAAAQLGLVALGFWRFSGHWVEPLPPGTADNREFLPLAECARPWRVLPAAALGYLSEFSAGLPFRLVNSWFFLMAQRLGFEPERAISWRAADEIAGRIHREGWGAHPTTREIVAAARALEPAPAVDCASPEPRRATGGERIRLMACDAGASVWLVEIAGKRVLFDTWLDETYFAFSPRFFFARRLEPPAVPVSALPQLDAIVLSSGQQDHCDPATLARLDPRVPVFARREGARAARAAGFASVTTLAPGVPCELFDGAVSALGLASFGLNLAVVLRDNATGERICIAQHGLDARWLARHEARILRGPFARDASGSLVSTLCLGVHTTSLHSRFLPAWLLGAHSTNVPDPRDSAEAVARLGPQRVLFSHCTREVEDGWAPGNFIHYPTAADDVGYAKQVLGAACPRSTIEGLPPAAVWV